MLRVVGLLLLVLVGTLTVHGAQRDRDVDAYFDGRSDAVRELARGVAAALDEESRPDAHHTGSEHMNAEWAYVTAMMGVIGLSKAAYGDPNVHAEARRRATAKLVDDAVLGFGTRAWGGERWQDAKSGHAYLGWGALALGHARALDPSFAHVEAHDRMVALLRASVEASPHGVFETFPGVTFPADVAVCVGAIGLHDRLTGGRHAALVARAAKRLVEGFSDPATGFLFQRVVPDSGRVEDGPRGSGTSIAAYALSFADQASAATLARALKGRTRSLWGFSGVEEYADGSSGLGDIDSGPVLLGVSVAATGFSLAVARQAGDRAWFRGLARTTHLFGVPRRSDGTRRYATGGAIGNAVLLAMLTAEKSLPRRVRIDSLRDRGRSARDKTQELP